MSKTSRRVFQITTGYPVGLTVKDVEKKPQFWIQRDYSQLKASKILLRIDARKNLQSLFSEHNPDVIAHKLNVRMNEIAKYLIIKMRFQFKKEEVHQNHTGYLSSALKEGFLPGLKY